MKILVTGSSGFVGRALCPFLATQGHDVVRGVRCATLAGQVTLGDIGPVTDWTMVLSGIEAVVHLAARVHVMQDSANALALYDEVNHLGTVNLAMQAARAGVRRFVFLSSVKVLGEEGYFLEESLPAPQDTYGLSKWQAEKGLHTVAQNTGLEVVILRPPLIHGPGVGANMARLITWVRHGVPLPLGSVHNQRSLLGLGNLVDAIGWLLIHPAAAGKPCLLSDGEPLSTPQLITLLADVMECSARLIAVPPRLLHWAAGLVGREAEVARLMGSLVVEDTLLRNEWGWRQPYTLREGLRRAVDLSGLEPRSL